jgi:hypothetical protein
MTLETGSDLHGHVRAVTDQEVAQFEEQGWVMLNGLISAELATEMLEVARRHATLVGDARWRIEGELALAGVEPYRSFAFGREMERNAQRLCNRVRLSGNQVPLRFHHERAMSKEPGALGTPYHQDATEEGSDRIGQVNLWLALDEVTPEMGAMRFITGAHREGPLGMAWESDQEVDGLLRMYPRLLEIHPLSPPLHYRPGDATAHQGYTPHGGPPNTTDRPRWSYIWGYIPADTRYINGNAIRPGIDRVEADDGRFPLLDHQ